MTVRRRASVRSMADLRGRSAWAVCVFVALAAAGSNAVSKATPAVPDVRADTADATGRDPVPPVPPTPPDTFPSDYRTNWDPAWGAARDMIGIMFRPGTTVEQKTEAITAVEGRVVGGLPFSPDDPLDGDYFIRIDDGGSMDPAVEAARRLRAYPFVLSASLFLHITGPKQPAN